MSAKQRTAPLILAMIYYDTEAPDGQEIGVVLTESGKRVCSTLTDFELSVLAVEAGLMVRKKFEMPPSPKTINE